MSKETIALQFAQQLDAIVDELDQLRQASKHEDCSDVMSDAKAIEIATRAYAAIERAGGRNTPYVRQAEGVRGQRELEQTKAIRLGGVAASLSSDLKAGYLRTFKVNRPGFSGDSIP